MVKARIWAGFKAARCAKKFAKARSRRLKAVSVGLSTGFLCKPIEFAL